MYKIWKYFEEGKQLRAIIGLIGPETCEAIWVEKL